MESAASGAGKKIRRKREREESNVKTTCRTASQWNHWMYSFGFLWESLVTGWSHASVEEMR